ncbi:MAG: hypothetical protein J0L62_07755 [Bacteroidetes bacterium]|nr:hypothetical protein [Bacteroidota bacterium]
MSLNIARVFKLVVRLVTDTISSLSSIPFSKTSDGLLVIKSDGIGDYFLFRPFLPILKAYAQQKNWTVTLLVQNPVYSFSMEHDQKSIDFWTLFDQNQYMKSLLYRFSFNRKIRKHHFATAFIPMTSRNINCHDSLIRNCIAIEKVGVIDDSYNSYLHRSSIITDTWFTKLLDPAILPNDFEYIRNRKVIAAFTGFTTEEVEKRENVNLQVSHSGDFPKTHIVIFHGASSEQKRWNPENWITLFKAFPVNQFVLCGGTQEITQGQYIAKSLSSFGHHVDDQTGKTSLEQMAGLIGNAKVLVSNETMAVHIAFLCKTPTLVITNGNHYLRFHPYPQKLAPFINFVYPSRFKNSEPEISDTIHKTGIYETSFDINEVEPKQVLDDLNNLLSGCYE